MNVAQPLQSPGQEAPAGACLNCGTPLTDLFCARCGQKARLRRSLGAFVGDMLAGAFNFEGKFWRTIPALVWRPGELTRRYIEGQRASFISPPALYLFTVFLMFAVLNFSGQLDIDQIGSEARVKAEQQREVIAKLDGERALAVKAGRDTSEIDRRLGTARAELDTLDRVGRGGAVQLEGFTDSEIPAWLRTPIERANRDPQRAIASVLEASSKYSWLLIPLSLPFMWLLFPFRRNTRMFDHAVFVTYSISFMMLLVIAASLLTLAKVPGFASALLLAVPLHLYRQVKAAYGLRRFGALWRTFFLLFFCQTAILAWGVAVTAIGLA